MIDISQKEFEAKVRELTDGKITRKGLAKELNTDLRTLYNKITQLSVSNKELYTEYVKKYPYKPKKISISDMDTFAIMIIDSNVETVAKKLGISLRTMSRKINTLKETNPELYELYCQRYKHRTKREYEEYMLAVDKYRKDGTVVQRNEEDEQLYSLTMFAKRFNDLVKEGNSKADAARIIGLHDYPTAYKKLQGLKRKEAELNALKEDEKKQNGVIADSKEKDDDER